MSSIVGRFDFPGRVGVGLPRAMPLSNAAVGFQQRARFNETSVEMHFMKSYQFPQAGAKQLA
jgi:hypothetical protein